MHKPGSAASGKLGCVCTLGMRYKTSQDSSTGDPGLASSEHHYPLPSTEETFVKMNFFLYNRHSFHNKYEDIICFLSTFV